MKKIRIGTRGSKLALKQAALVQEALRQADGEIEAEIVIIHTKGDRVQDRPLTEIGEKGVFASELERALQDGKIDLAVHSAKDLPMALAEGLAIAAVLPRADVRDVLVVPKGGRRPVLKADRQLLFMGREEGTAEAGGTGDLAAFIIGSGSRRRQCLAVQSWENVVCEDIRGNVDTRLRKLSEGNLAENAGVKTRYHGIILAKAGLDRLDITSENDSRFDFIPLVPECFLPAACQGMIAVEVVRDSAAAALCERITDAATALCFLVEREVLAALSADCSEAIAAWCRQEGGKLVLDVMYAGRRVQLTHGADFKTEAGKENELLRAGLQMARAAAERVREKT